MSSTDLAEFLRARISDDERIVQAAAAHIARHDPARALAGVAATRRILDLHTVERDPRALRFLREGPADGPYCTACFGQYHPCETLRLLALPYQDHPDYRPDWAPDPE
ncbi:DUF6221 family protein [Kitasatospora sp. NPDC091335]|uniref:DUF6221 family protein n=1 Tax=Kitasatospora sp. NPDC091335 TaxID=3364085 RepID=UPI00380D3F33